MASPDSVETLDKRWDQMDDLGYAGKMGSNKPALTKQLVEARKPSISLAEGNEEISEGQQSMLIPQTSVEKTREANANLKPDGTRKPRRKRRHDIDNSRGMRGIGDNRFYG